MAAWLVSSLKPMSKSILYPTVLAGLVSTVISTPLFAQSLLEKARGLANSAVGKRFHAAENLALLEAIRNGAMPPQPAEGGCNTPEAKIVIEEFLYDRHRIAELAEYSRLVYERDNLQAALAQAHLDPAERQFQDVYYDPQTALGYLLVKQHGSGGKTDVTLVFEGSTFVHGRTDAIKKFIGADAAQLVSKTMPAMFLAAEKVYLATAKKYPSREARLTLTGHSLGGTLAMYLGAKYNVHTVTFNPARLSAATFENAVRYRPELVENDVRSIRNITHISASTDAVHFMGIPSQVTYLPGESFVFRVEPGDLTGHGIRALSQVVSDIASAPLTPDEICENYYGNNPTWSALNAKLSSPR